MRLLSAGILLLFAFLPMQSENVFNSFLGNYNSHTLESQKLILHCQGGRIELTPFTEEIIKVEVFEDADTQKRRSFAVFRNPEKVQTKLTNNPDFLVYSSGTIKTMIRKYPLKLSFIKDGDTLLKEKFGTYHMGWGFGNTFEKEPGEMFFGTGERALPQDRNNYFLRNNNSHRFRYTCDHGWMSIGIPFYISSKMYGLFMDNHEVGIMDFGTVFQDAVIINAYSNHLRYYVIFGDSYGDILKRYTKLTGFQRFLPRWALGYMQSRMIYFTSDQTREIVSNMQNDSIPLDVILLDVGWFGAHDSLGSNTWKGGFQDGTVLVDDLLKKSIKTIPIFNPYFLVNNENFDKGMEYDCFVKNENDMPYEIDILEKPSVLADVSHPASEEFLWNLYDPLVRDGIAGFWLDYGEPQHHEEDMKHYLGSAAYVHNIFNLFWMKMIFKKSKEIYPDKRMLMISRSGWVGMGKYGVCNWSGDVDRSYLGMKFQIPLMIGAGISGVPYLHSDIGGFSGSPSFPIRFIRWMQLGAFSPIMRTHNAEIPAEPFRYEEPYKSILRKFINLRYKLIPYNYTLMWENHKTGIPLMRQMDFYENDNPNLYRIDDQYFWGENFISAPVIDSLALERNVILPEGRWFSYWDHSIYDGSATVTVPAPLDEMPLLVRSGSIIPTAPVYQSLDYYNSDSLIVEYYYDEKVSSSSFSMYNDDGITDEAYKRSRYEVIEFKADNSQKGINFNIDSKGPGFQTKPFIRGMLIKMINVTKDQYSIELNGSSLKFYSNKDDFTQNDSCVWWDRKNSILYVKFTWRNDPSSIEVTYGTSSVSSFEGKCKLLDNPYPNPFSKTVFITVNIKKSGIYKLRVFDVNGKSVFEQNNYYLPGKYVTAWSPDEISTGLYKAVISSEEILENRNLIFINE